MILSAAAIVIYLLIIGRPIKIVIVAVRRWKAAFSFAPAQQSTRTINIRSQQHQTSSSLERERRPSR